MKNAIWLFCLAIFMRAAPSWAVEIDGKDWLQPVDYLSLSWNQVDAQCPLPMRVCNAGAIPGIEGYTWASQAQILSLYASFGVPPPEANQVDSPWAPAVFTVFSPTFQIVGSVRQLNATASDNAVLQVVPLLILTDNLFSPGLDNIVTQPGYAQFDRNPFVGHHFFKIMPAAPVPEPVPAAPVPALPIYGLMTTICGLLFLSSRRLTKRKAREG